MEAGGEARGAVGRLSLTERGAGVQALPRCALSNMYFQVGGRLDSCGHPILFFFFFGGGGGGGCPGVLRKDLLGDSSLRKQLTFDTPLYGAR